MPNEPTCYRCKKAASQIEEYVESAREDEATPANYVRSNEGTYNPATNRFCCTDCYIAIGMPVTAAGWIAP